MLEKPDPETIEAPELLKKQGIKEVITPELPKEMEAGMGKIIFDIFKKVLIEKYVKFPREKK